MTATASEPTITHNGTPAPHLKAVRHNREVVGVCDPATGAVYLEASGTGPVPDMSILFGAARNPPREIVKVEGKQFVPAAWIIAAGICDAELMAKRADRVRAMAGAASA